MQASKKRTAIGVIGVWALLALGIGGCTSHVTTFVRSVAFAPNGDLLVTTCTLDEDGFTRSNDVDGTRCSVDAKRPQVRP